MNSCLKYPGAKNRIAPWIVSHIPPHKTYVEPYFGSGAVFFHKEPCKIETINDLDEDVYNFFRQVREHPEELAALLELTPFSRAEYEHCYDKGDTSDIERARRFAVRLYQGYSSSGRYMNGWRQSKAVTSPHTTKLWAKYPDMIVQAAARLKEAQIECRPALDVIEAHNSPDTFLYVDPPYYPEVRKPCIYTHEMRKEDHEELLDVLLQHKGRVLLSGYDNPLYNDALKNWKKYSKDTTADSGMRRTETLWANFDNPEQLMLSL